MISNTNDFAKIWNKESESYSFDKDSEVDHLANFYHLSHCFGSVKGKTILEVGSGTGQASAFLASKGGIIYLVDISKKSLEFAKKYFDSKNLPVKIYVEDAFSMKFKTESFDYVWNGGVIEHFNDDEKVLMLKKMWGLVKPGGKLLVAFPNALDFQFMIAKKILEFRKKWTFGTEDDLTTERIKNLAKLAGIKKFYTFAYNPVVGFWFFPYGREITNALGLNTFKKHKSRTPLGHVVIFSARKPK